MAEQTTVSASYPGGPGIGTEAVEGTSVCAYTGRTPAGPICGRPTVVHVLSANDEYGVVMLSACEEHEVNALKAGRWLGSHPFKVGVCDRPEIHERHWGAA